MTVTHHVGPALDLARSLPDGSIDASICSPPFLALRNYSDLPGQWGAEPTPAQFLANLLTLATETRRTLTPHGSLAWELGDTYSGSGGSGGDYLPGGMRDGQNAFDGSARAASAQRWRAKQIAKAQWPLPKSLCLIPTLFAACLAYGRNLLDPTAEPFEPWRVRNVIVWARNNPPVGALGDKVRPAVSYITVACTSERRWFDLDSIRGGASAARAAGGAVLGVADSAVLRTTLEADGRPSLHGWCKPGRSKVTVGPPVTWQAQRLQVVEPVGFLVGVEEVVGAKVMDLQAAVAPASAAAVAIAVESLFAGTVPVPTSVAGTSSVPAGVVLASDVDAPPLSGTLESAEVVSTDLALVPGQWLAARVALKLNGACATARAITPLARGELSSWHSEEPRSNNGAPPLDHWWDEPDGDLAWLINTQGSSLSHYAMWPPKLAERLVLSMVPAEVCRVCGEPRRRITGPAEYVPSEHYRGGAHDAMVAGTAKGTKVNQWTKDGQANASVVRSAPTLGWSDCGHGSFRPGIVCDPFAGTGTTLAVADIHGRDAIGFDLDPANQGLYPTRYAQVWKALGRTSASPVTAHGQQTALW